MIAVLILCILRHLHPRPFGQGTDGIGIAQSFDLHLEIDDASALMAAEAIVNSLFRVDGEGSGLFTMEGAQAKQIGAGATQIDILAHDLLNWVPGRQFFQK